MRSISSIVLIAVLIIIAFFVVPMVAEGTTNSCRALEMRTVTKTATNIAGAKSGPVYSAINIMGQSAATGEVASEIMRQQHPDVPPPITCTWHYWKSVLGN